MIELDQAKNKQQGMAFNLLKASEQWILPNGDISLDKLDFFLQSSIS